MAPARQAKPPPGRGLDPRRRRPGCPGRASAGWLLEHVGCRPGQKIAEGIRFSELHPLTPAAYNGATTTGFAWALTDLAGKVEHATSITLNSEPVPVGSWP